jgi:surface carbohydrate biosynthesis protein
MQNEVLIIPCETQAREFDAKLLLACFAAERGFRVIVGSKKEINRRVGSLPRGLFLSKSLTRRNLLMYKLLDRLGHAILCGDEEALVYASRASYLHHKVAGVTLREARALLAWGTENASMWSEFSGYDGAPIHVTGNARMDLLRPELRGLFEPRVDALRQRYGSYILINTNFSRLNHYFEGQSRQLKALESMGANADERDLGVGLAAHKARLYEAFLEMVPALARAFPDHRIVLRPHPSENEETWDNVTRGLENVSVLREGNVVPWLLASDVMIHNGCQTAVESYLLQSAAIAYQPVTSEEFDLQLPNLLSQRAFGLAELIDTVKSQLAGAAAREPEEVAAQEDLIEQFVAARTGPLACERIVSVLEDFAQKADFSARPPLSRWLPARIVADARGLMQAVEAYIPGHHNNRVYLDHMFPGISLADVRERIGLYARMLGRFDGVEVSVRHDKIFEVVGR